jgi:hypothetical protein
LSCAICERRKEKRFCPAVHGRICAQCCGEQREVTLDCPSGCPYLQQAREHERPRSMGQFDPASLFLEVEIPDQFLYEREPLLMGLSFALAKGARSDRTMHDSDLIAALSTLCTRYERLVNSGLLYEQTLTNIAQQAIASEVEAMVKQYREVEQKHAGYSSLRDSEVLRALVYFCFEWLTDEPQAVPSRVPSWIFSWRSFRKGSQHGLRPRKLPAGLSCPNKLSPDSHLSPPERPMLL